VTFDLSNPRLLVGPDWVDAPAGYDVVDPYTGGPIARCPLGDAAALDAAVAAAVGAFAAARRQPPFERAAVLHRAAALIAARRSQFADLIVAESGKPVTLAEGEVDRAVATFTAAGDEARQPNGQVLDVDAARAGAGHFGLARRFPLGVIYGITPFNFPINLVAHKVAPAIATGNCIVIKPAPKTPLTALMLAGVLVEAGVLPGQVSVVTCPNELAGRLVEDERVAKVSFTGSPKVGWPVKQRAGKKRVTLELGGNGAVIVHDDADVAAAVPMIAAGAFAYAGQSCISVQRVLVQENIYTRFREQFVAHVRAHVKAGDPRDRAVLVGPLVDRVAVARITAWVRDATSGGGRLLTGGTVDGQVMQPTVLEGVDPRAELWANEAFAPVALLRPYATFDDALRLANDSVFGLQAGVFTRDVGLAMRAFEELQVGGVMVNQVPTFRVETMPYGGVKDSGFGREGVRYAMEEMTELRSLVVKL